jgi:protein TonB
MRTWTLGASIVFHLCLVTGIIVAPLFATDDLPEPPRRNHGVVIEVVPTPPPEARAITAARSTNAAPVEAPESVVPEPPAPLATPLGPTDFDVVGGDPNAAGFTRTFVPGGEPLPPPPPPPPAPRQVLRVGGDIRPPQKVRDVAPRYPALAQASKVQGVVILEATIGEDGSVRDVRVLRGKPLLDGAAVDAVRQWRFTPTLLNGEPVPVVMTVTVAFTLN